MSNHERTKIVKFHRLSLDVAGEGKEPHRKNPAAVALGKLGGSKGGNARAAKLSAGRRKQIAENAAAIRWGKVP